MLIGAALNWAWINRDMPASFTLPTNPGAMVVRTKGGNPVVVSLDANERMYIIDTKGNIYYDSGDPRLGWNVVCWFFFLGFFLFWGVCVMF